MRAAKRTASAGAVLCFLDGGYLALLCFAILPCAMGAQAFYPAVAASLAGVGVGFLSERREGWHMLLQPLLFAALTGLYALQGCAAEHPALLVLLGFCGGMGLYHACAGILPEEVEPRERIGEMLSAGLGFCAGTLLFAGLL